MKNCKKCDVSKPLADYHKDKNTKDGLARWCKVCAKENSKKYYEANPEKHLKRKYGISLEDKKQMLVKQSNKCQICNTELQLKQAVVDHCHTHGNVRGLLCNSCNSLLGFSKDNVTTLKNAIKYLYTQHTGDLHESI
jgi:hypothetical protein